jgi:hypothetical protein
VSEDHPLGNTTGVREVNGVVLLDFYFARTRLGKVLSNFLFRKRPVQGKQDSDDGHGY